MVLLIKRQKKSTFWIETKKRELLHEEQPELDYFLHCSQYVWQAGIENYFIKLKLQMNIVSAVNDSHLIGYLSEMEACRHSSFWDQEQALARNCSEHHWNYRSCFQSTSRPKRVEIPLGQFFLGNISTETTAENGGVSSQTKLKAAQDHCSGSGTWGKWSSAPGFNYKCSALGLVVVVPDRQKAISQYVSKYNFNVILEIFPSGEG